MKLFSYKLNNDSGFAPNPFWGICTLATCKARIREKKGVGVWLAGFTSGELCGDKVGEERLIYLMKITDKILMSRYFKDEKYAIKKPDLSKSEFIYKAGDNIYCPSSEYAINPQDFTQLPNMNHWDFQNDCESEDTKTKDISGKYVLLSTEYYYFGRNALKLPADIRPKVPKGQAGQGIRTHDEALAVRFIDYIRENYKVGVHGCPFTWPSGDDSWKEQFQNENYIKP